MVRLCLLPALVAILYAAVTQWHRRSVVYIVLLLIGGFIALFNAASMYGFFMQLTPSWELRCFQQVLSCMIIPIAYMYFSAQMGRKWLNDTTVTLWMLLALLAYPTGFFPLDRTIPMVDQQMMEPMTFHFFSQGKHVYRMRSADIVIVVQALVTLFRVVMLAKTMRRYRLSLSPRLRYFGLWWIAALIFVIFTSFHTTEDFRQPSLLYTYYIFYSALVVGICWLISRNFDLRLVMLSAQANEEVDDLLPPDDALHSESPFADDAPGTNQGDKVIENLDTFYMQDKLIVERLRRMLDVEKRYLDPDFTAATAIQELVTNRPYFCRMVKAEFGCTFAELLQSYRTKHAANQ